MRPGTMTDVQVPSFFTQRSSARPAAPGGRSLSSEEARTALFGREDGVDPVSVWQLDYPAVGRMHQAIGGGSLIVFDQGKLGRIALDTGERAWERDSEHRPSTVMSYDGGVTVVAFDNGSIYGIDSQGKDRWSHQASQVVFQITPGSVATLTLEKQPEHKPFHLAIEPSTGEVLWKQPGANYEAPQPFPGGTRVLKASNRMVCVEPGTGEVKAEVKFNGYGRDIVASPEGKAWLLDDNAVRKFRLEDGQFVNEWNQELDAKAGALVAPPDRSVLYVTVTDRILGLDPASGGQLWSQPLPGDHSSVMMQLTPEGDLLVPARDQLTCVSKTGTVRWSSELPGLSRARQTPRGLVALSEQRHAAPYRLQLLHPATGKVVLWAEVPRGGSVPWLDEHGRVLVTSENRVEMFGLPHPDTIPPDGRVVLERPDAVVVGGVVVRKRGGSEAGSGD